MGHLILKRVDFTYFVRIIFFNKNVLLKWQVDTEIDKSTGTRITHSGQVASNLSHF
jgi:hypothetical protein